MSRKKQKDATKSMITDSQLQETIKNNQDIRKLKITHKKFTESQNKFLDIAFAAGASSFAPGAFFDSFKIQKPTSLHFNYWSPSSPIETGKKNMYDTFFIYFLKQGR